MEKAAEEEGEERPNSLPPLSLSLAQSIPPSLTSSVVASGEKRRARGNRGGRALRGTTTTYALYTYTTTYPYASSQHHIFSLTPFFSILSYILTVKSLPSNPRVGKKFSAREASGWFIAK